MPFHELLFLSLISSVLMFVLMLLCSLSLKVVRNLNSIHPSVVEIHVPFICRKQLAKSLMAGPLCLYVVVGNHPISTKSELFHNQCSQALPSTPYLPITCGNNWSSHIRVEHNILFPSITTHSYPETGAMKSYDIRHSREQKLITTELWPCWH